MVLHNDAGDELRIADDAAVVVALGANLWKKDEVDIEQTKAEKYDMQYTRPQPLSEYVEAVQFTLP